VDRGVGRDDALSRIFREAATGARARQRVPGHFLIPRHDCRTTRPERIAVRAKIMEAPIA